MRRVSPGGKSLPAVDALPSLVGQGVSPQERTAPSAVLKRVASRSSAAAVGLTPSLARIADKDVTVEVRGLPQAPPFKVGGKHGNIVTNSTLSRIHRGWRIVAVSGQRVAAQEVAAAIATAQKGPRYSVTFRIGTGREDDDDDEHESEDAQAQELERQRKQAEAELRRKEEQEEARQKTAEEEAKRLEAERQRQQEEKANKEKAQEEAKLQVVRKEVEVSLEKSTGLLPRAKVEEPQRALMAALSRPKDVSAVPPKPKKGTGPCDKCDGPHDTDDCPYFKKPRDDHKDAFDRYGGDKNEESKDSQKSEQPVLRSAKVVPQPGDGSCLFHSLAFGLGSTEASALRAEIADFIAAYPDTEVSDNPIRDWVLWDSGLDPKTYACSMREGSRWGGAVELAVCAKIRKVAVDVFEKRSDGFARISSFGQAGEGKGASTVRLLYGGRVHYDALQT